MSIAAVVIFHLWPEVLPSGFIGVDIFFVISGFLITQHLRDSLAAGHLRFGDFYARRVRRLFPALLVVLALTMVLGSAVLLEAEWKTLGRHTLAGLAYVSNFVLWREGGYFDTPSFFKPLHHLWSLAVEEQFYLVWPWVLWLGHRAGRRGVPAGVVTVLVVSFATNLALTLDDPDAAFHLPFGRLWELALGAALTLGSARGAVKSNALALIGCALLGLAFATTSRAGFPGVMVLLPCLGAAALIASPTSAVSRLLASRPLVVLGLISYPLYLWHWPLSVYARLTTGRFTPESGALTPLASWVVLLSSVVAAILTWRFVERPVRVGKIVSVPALLGASAIMFGVALLASAGLVKPSSTPSEAVRERTRVYEAAAAENIAPKGFTTKPLPPYTLFLFDERPAEVAFVGDSNMLQYGDVLGTLARRTPARPFVLLTSDGCPPFMEVDNPSCRGNLSVLKAALEDPSLRTVVFAAQWSLYFANPRFTVDGKPIAIDGAYAAKALAEFASWLERLARTRRVFLVTNVPTSPELDPLRMVRRTWWSGLQFETTPLPRRELQARVESATERLRAVARESGAIVIDPFESLCEPAVCAREEAGVPLYRDEHHVRPSTLVAKFHAFDALLAP